MENLVYLIEDELINDIRIESPDPNDPIKVRHLPRNWKLIGIGNYAAVVCHKDYPQYAVKIYADGKAGLEEEKRVYQRLGKHHSFSECYHYGSNYLVLKRLHGITLYDCLKKGIYIPGQVIDDIDSAISYARGQGLYPHDVHFKNVMMYKGRGIVLDISDFLKKEYCPLWKDTKKFYNKVYRMLPVIFPIPELLLNTARKTYRFYKKVRKNGIYCFAD